MISIIIPVYNVEKYLRQCLESIIKQTYKNYEVLLINDGSTDRSGMICEEYEKRDKRFRVIQTKNEGVSAARNLGIKNSKGEYIGFIDSDDWIEPEMFEDLLGRIEETQADISCCSYWIERGNTQKTSIISEKIYTGTESLKALFNGEINSYLWCKLIKRDIMKSIVFPVGKIYEDFSVMHIIIGKAKKVSFIPKAEYHYRSTYGSLTRTWSAKQLVDYADAYLLRYNYFCDSDVFSEKEKLLILPAKGIVKVWRWWYGCTKEENLKYKEKIRELRNFSRCYLPLVGPHAWPSYLRITVAFTHSNSSLVFALLYWINQLFRHISPGDAW